MQRLPPTISQNLPLYYISIDMVTHFLFAIVLKVHPVAVKADKNINNKILTFHTF